MPCDAAIKSHPKEMATTAFIARDKRSIPLFTGMCWGYKFKKNTQLEGESLRLLTTYLAQRKFMTELHVETDLVKLLGISNSGYKEKYVTSNLNWSFLSRSKEELVRPNDIWFGVVCGSMNKFAHDSKQTSCLYHILEFPIVVG